MEEEMEECEQFLPRNSVLLVEASDLEGAVEGTGSMPVDIEAMEGDDSGDYENDSDSGILTLMVPLRAEEHTALMSSVVQDNDEDSQEDDEQDAAMKLRFQDIRNVTSQYLQGDLTCTEYASAMDRLVDDGDNESDESETDDAQSFEKFLRRQAGKGQDSQDQGGPSLLALKSSSKDSSGGFYGSGTDPATFSIFRKRKLSTTLQRLIGAAHVRYAQGDYKSAIDMCMEIIKEQPTCVEPFQTLSMIYENQGRASKSLQFALIAALLSPKSCTEWPKLGEMSFEENNLPQAIMCYTKAVKVEPRNPILFRRRCELMDLHGDSKGALKSYAQILILFPEESPLCIDVLRKMARIYYDGGEIDKAFETLNVAFNEHFKSQITMEEINLMLELCIALKKYVEALELIIDHLGVKMTPVLAPKAFQNRATLTQALKNEEITFHIPGTLNVELLAKLIGILIHLEAFHLSEKLVEVLKNSDVNVFGDLYLDVAESYMSKQNYALAVTTLLPLVESNKYSVAAVWLRYAECLYLLDRLEDAAEAYEKVVILAPTHSLAKLNLSIILQRLGRADDALETLVTERDEVPIDPALLLERCNILLKAKRSYDFIHTARTMLSRHCLTVRNMEEGQIIVMATNKTKTRFEALQIDRKLRGERPDDDIPTFMDKETSVLAEWKIYLKLCQTLKEMERYDILSSVVYAAVSSKLFGQIPKMEKACEMHCFYASMMCRDPILLPLHVRMMLTNFPTNRRVLNIFSMVLKRCENDTRYGRHVLRLLHKRPNDKRLMLLNAHISFTTGTYKNALMDYATIYGENPKNPIVPLMMASVLLHVMTQKTTSSRAQLCITIIAFMKKYVELRGGENCQEACYNMGRVMHFLGFLPNAIYYYKRVFMLKPVHGPMKKERAAPIIIGGENIMDLKKEAAFNLALIYRASGANRLAKHYLFSYIRV